jgi:hypothetical protein
MLIFVFAGISCGRKRLILAEFAPVPNVQSVEAPASAASSSDVRSDAEYPISAATIIGKKLGVKDDCVEVGGPKGPEPTRFGDWERNGRCVDF